MEQVSLQGIELFNKTPLTESKQASIHLAKPINKKLKILLKPRTTRKFTSVSLTDKQFIASIYKHKI